MLCYSASTPNGVVVAWLHQECDKNCCFIRYITAALSLLILFSFLWCTTIKRLHKSNEILVYSPIKSLDTHSNFDWCC